MRLQNLFNYIKMLLSKTKSVFTSTKSTHNKWLKTKKIKPKQLVTASLNSLILNINLTKPHVISTTTFNISNFKYFYTRRLIKCLSSLKFSTVKLTPKRNITKNNPLTLL